MAIFKIALTKHYKKVVELVAVDEPATYPCPFASLWQWLF
jgi:hypothetical protein